MTENVTDKPSLLTLAPPSTLNFVITQCKMFGRNAPGNTRVEIYALDILKAQCLVRAKPRRSSSTSASISSRPKLRSCRSRTAFYVENDRAILMISREGSLTRATPTTRPMLSPLPGRRPRS